MNDRIGLRAIEIGNYFSEHKTTVRETATRFGVSKSTVHKDLTDRLKEYDYLLYEKIRIILDENKAERHLRGGAATKSKYLKSKKK